MNCQAYCKTDTVYGVENELFYVHVTNEIDLI